MIPDYQTLMLPFLKIIGDGQTYTTAEITPILAKEFNLTEEELNELTPTKTHKVFKNRVHWAKAQMKMYGIIDIVYKHTFKITERGKKLLEENPSAISNSYLKEKFKEEIPEVSVGETTGEIINTPEEQIDNGYLRLRKTLEVELLEKLKKVTPKFFENIVVELLVKMGYGGLIPGSGEVTKYTNDEGIDGIIKEDKLGLDIIYIQAKRWEGNVSRPEIQKFNGALAGKKAKKGVFITTSDFSKEARSYVENLETKIILINGIDLAQYMIDYNLGVSVQNTYEIKKIDSDYFEEE